MTDTPPAAPLPPGVRLLQWLVIVLTITLIGGVIVTVAALVTRLPGAGPAPMALPERVVLPEGITATAITHGQGWYAVVTADNWILIFDSADGRLRQEVAILSE